MRAYLGAVFKVLYAIDGASREKYGCSAAELAEAITLKAFDEADADRDDRLTREEFVRWFAEDAARLGETRMPEVLSPRGGGGGDSNLGRGRGRFRSATTALKSRPVGEVMEAFVAVTDDVGLISRSRFEGCLASLLVSSAPGGARREGSAERAASLNAALDLGENLFELFDANGDGAVDFVELCTGLTVLCEGTRDEKAASAFRLYDYNNDGVIDLDEMTAYLTSVFKVMYATQPGTQEQMEGAAPEELARVTAEEAFAEADLDADGRLSWDEFKAWYRRGAEGGDDDGEEDGESASSRRLVGRSSSDVRARRNSAADADFELQPRGGRRDVCGGDQRPRVRHAQELPTGLRRHLRLRRALAERRGRGAPAGDPAEALLHL